MLSQRTHYNRVPSPISHQVWLFKITVLQCACIVSGCRQVERLNLQARVERSLRLPGSLLCPQLGVPIWIGRSVETVSPLGKSTSERDAVDLFTYAAGMRYSSFWLIRKRYSLLHVDTFHLFY